MGHHYNPQRLLRNFQVPNHPGYIWQHDKQRDTPVCAAIKNVAQARNFYDPETEKRLNSHVEIPGGDAIDKILDNQPLTPEERIDLIIHIGTMLQCTPFYRQWVKDIVPKAMEIVRAHGRSQIRQFAKANQRSEQWEKAWLEQIEQSIAKLHGKPSEETIERMNNPFPSEMILGALLDMTWRIVESAGPQLFVTSDNPAVYIRCEGYGLGGKEAEVVMPISPHVALHGSRDRCHPNFVRVRAHQKIVRKMNKRLVSQASRFVYARDKAPWLGKILKRADLGVLRIGW